jgi:membrane carboxypeptidase/penicillin-binding protein PbpC
LNSSPSEIEAAAATLLVVVPANPCRAKHRLAALKINSRRKSLVIRNVLIIVSKHSPLLLSSNPLHRTKM